jgi:hypothetical protein
MKHAESIQVIARREPCLPRTDNDAVEHNLDYRGSGAAGTSRSPGPVFRNDP